MNRVSYMLGNWKKPKKKKLILRKGQIWQGDGRRFYRLDCLLHNRLWKMWLVERCVNIEGWKRDREYSMCFEIRKVDLLKFYKRVE